MTAGGMAQALDGPAGETRGLPLAERMRWVAFLPGFGELPPEVLEELAERVAVAYYAAGAEVLREGDEGESLFLILEGHAEVTTHGARGPVPLALLGPAEWFGELALLFGDARRRATVTALTPLTAIALPGSAFAAVMDRRPELRAAWQEAGDLLLRAKFVKAAAPFLQLPADRMRRLARSLGRRRFAAGEAIVRQGDAGDECHLLQRGRVAVVLAEEGGERRLAELGPGTLFGEVALLSEGPRSATVRALDDCETLVLRRADLLAAMEPGRGADTLVGALLRHRACLHRRGGVEAHSRATPEGESVTVLKDSARGSYLMLPPQGRFLWDRLDGGHSLRDVVVAWSRERGEFVPDLFAGLLIELAREGFVLGRGIPEPVAGDRPGPGRRVWRRLRQVVSRQYTLRGADPLFAQLYALFGRFLFSRAGAIAAAAAGFAGLMPALVAAQLPDLRGSPVAVILLLLPAMLLVTAVHELGHGLAAKAQGREVARFTLGWQWLWPVAFADTSETWLASPRERMVVGAAGVAGNWAVGGLAALALLVVPEPGLRLFLLELALLSYLHVLINLHPLFDLDGYYLLLDALEQPDLRRHAVRALRGEGGGEPAETRYAAVAVFYTLLFPAALFLLFSVVAERWLAGLTSPGFAAGVCWAVAAAGLLAAVFAAVRELREE